MMLVPFLKLVKDLMTSWLRASTDCFQVLEKPLISWVMRAGPEQGGAGQESRRRRMNRSQRLDIIILFINKSNVGVHASGGHDSESLHVPPAFPASPSSFFSLSSCPFSIKASLSFTKVIIPPKGGDRISSMNSYQKISQTQSNMVFCFAFTAFVVQCITFQTVDSKMIQL